MTAATSDALALTQAAMLDRCNIRVDGYTFTDTGRQFWIVYEDVYERGWFEHEAHARAFADELTRDLFDAGPVGEISL